MAKHSTSCLPTSEGLEDVWVLFLVSEANLDEVSSAAVDTDVRQLQADDLTGLSNDESCTGQLWPRCHKGEVAVGGQHVQASYKVTHTHT